MPNRSRLLIAATLCLALLAGGCRASSDTGAGAADAGLVTDQPARHAVSGLPLADLQITTADNRTHNFRVEMAKTGEEQAQGLMFRTALGDGEGMLFPLVPPREASFWMKNTVIPLDIIYISPNRTVGRIAANTTPYSLSPISSMGMAAAVLELRGGRAAELGIRTGDAVKW